MGSKGTLCGWGRLPVPGREILSEDLAAASRGLPLSRGLGRSYGDASLPPSGHPVAAASRLADRFLAFDPATRILRAEAGLSLGELTRALLPRGVACPVFTGTRHVTLGGMVAADVHGKNHHQAGCIGAHIERLRMQLADGRILWCSRQEHRDLFLATQGGMGLTGHILEVELGLQAVPSPWVYAESERAADLDALLRGLKEASGGWPMTVAWLDGLGRGRRLGRGIVIRGRWAEPDEAPAKGPPLARGRWRVPWVLPGWVLSRPSVRLFNSLYYLRHPSRLRRRVTAPGAFFHPLDGIRDWNRLYGPHGFTQYQCVLPAAGGVDGVRRFLELFIRLGAPTFLCVLKDCGEEGAGMLSFPMAGTTVALDLPMRRDTQEVVDQLNEQVIAEGGRIYLAKDALTRPEHFRAMEPRLPRFLEARRRWDPEGCLSSAQAERLLGDMA